MLLSDYSNGIIPTVYNLNKMSNSIGVSVLSPPADTVAAINRGAAFPGDNYGGGGGIHC